ncbi:putative glycoside hydrolase [Teredinibacter franksiae]|uniref:putative glycoside hydrolase n=1 Tax=Teredinibacter franksiae TaxID=2761453 RepID=UPI001625633E|nr:putative glycoside hydrolase [Teredinibacter franksiae]
MKLKVLNISVFVVVAVSVLAALTMNSSESPKDCETQPGNIFVDCIDPAWYGISSWEMRFDEGSQATHSQTQASDLVQWRVVDDDETNRGRVLDIRYTNKAANGRLRFHARGAGKQRDLSEYAKGSIEFDVRVLRWGSAEKALIARVNCGFPCSSGPIRVEIPQARKWKSVSIPVADLIASGLDISRVDIGLAISPAWNRMQGIHFQLDNIRWVKPTESSESSSASVQPLRPGEQISQH